MYRNSTESTEVEFNEGDVIYKWGTVALSGWTEDAIQSRTTVVAIESCKVVLNVSHSAIRWWGEISETNTLFKETGDGTWRQFTWTDVGVSVVESDNSLASETHLIEKFKNSSAGKRGFYNDALFIKTYVNCERCAIDS